MFFRDILDYLNVEKDIRFKHDGNFNLEREFDEFLQNYPNYNLKSLFKDINKIVKKYNKEFYHNCNYFNKIDGFCMNGANEFDGLCSIEACPLSKEKQKEQFGLEIFYEFEIYNLNDLIEGYKREVKSLKEKIKNIMNLLNELQDDFTDFRIYGMEKYNLIETIKIKIKELIK